ncbi:MAG: hypothetical protein NZZ41_04325 [Candidatus Dojkabacteria bacterium]|nr:hypothetical protein [Candidatus Dojkabacteria bacterium]
MIKFEITNYTYNDLENNLEIIREFNIDSICVTNHFNSIDSIIVAQYIKAKLPHINITLNYAINKYYNDSIEDQYNHFVSFLQKSITFNVNNILLVSGNAKNRIKSSDLLVYAKNYDSFLHNVNIGVAYNPFFIERKKDEEKYLLKLKLSNTNVTGVYFQLGDNLIKIRSGINFTKKLSSIYKRRIEIWVSILFPTLHTISRLKNKPWKGVCYSKKFLNNSNFRILKTANLIKLVQKNNVNAVFCIYPFTKENLQQFMDFYGSLNIRN